MALICTRRVRLDMRKSFFSKRAAQGAVGPLEVFQNQKDVALRDVGSQHGGGGLCLALEILEIFSNL